jgi:hypothetical protein
LLLGFSVETGPTFENGVVEISWSAEGGTSEVNRRAEGGAGEIGKPPEGCAKEVRTVIEGRANEPSPVTEVGAIKPGGQTDARSREEGSAWCKNWFGLSRNFAQVTAPPPSALGKVDEVADSKPSKLISSFGGWEKSTPAKVACTSLLVGSRRHAFHASLPFSARSRKKV